MAATMTTSKTKTLVIVILDESGSMENKKRDVIGGYNQFLFKQRDERSTDETRLTLIKFSTLSTVIHQPMGINVIPTLNEQNYNPGGSTALFDAIANGVRTADRAKQQDERVLCLVITDGEENASRETTVSQVRNLIAEREARGDWTFTYIGEQPDRWSRALGVDPTNMAPYLHHNVQQNFQRAADATFHFLQRPAQQQQQHFY